jgi:hypothetical protein
MDEAKCRIGNGEHSLASVRPPAFESTQDMLQKVITTDETPLEPQMR